MQWLIGTLLMLQVYQSLKHLGLAVLIETSGQLGHFLSTLMLEEVAAGAALKMSPRLVIWTCTSASSPAGHGWNRMMHITVNCK